MAKVVTSQMLLNAKAEVTSLETDTSFIKEKERQLAAESDEAIMKRLGERFEILEDMTRAVKKGDVRAMIVTGPPGVGKSFGVEKVLSKHDVFANVAQDGKLKKYEIVKGAMSAIGLYSKLYEFSDKKSILVFDDCDSILMEDLSLNILKAALDSSKKRTISWNTDSRLLRSEGVPNSFEFKGGCIFISNIKFDHVRSKKLKDHLEALESRCHYLDLTIDTEREKLLRIRQVVTDCGMLDEYDLDEFAKKEVVEFITANASRMRELSLRMVLKVADIRASMPAKWQAVVEVTCMRGSR
jgi:ATPase family associated with various cellular activities (AAA)